MRSVCKALEPYGDSMRTYALFRRKLGKLNVQAKICTPPGGAMLAKICIVLLACRLGAATFYRHDTLVTAAVQLGSLLVSLPHLPYSLLPLLSFLSSPSSYPLLAKICIPHPSDHRWANLRKYALWRHTQERIEKTCAPPKSYYPRMKGTV